MMAASGCPATNGQNMNDCDWLTAEMKQSEREYQALPESARPVVIPSVEAVRDTGLLTEAQPRIERPTEGGATESTSSDN